jgi:hypothetical protein
MQQCVVVWEAHAMESCVRLEMEASTHACMKQRPPVYAPLARLCVASRVAIVGLSLLWQS